jgi:putative transcriptional regulator
MKKNIILYKKGEIMQINPGDILVASPTMNDEYFDNSMILISAVNAQAVVGFIINRASTMPVSELFDNLDEYHRKINRRVFIGGPVEESTLHMIALGNVGGKEIVPGVRMGGRWNSVEEMLSSDEDENRLILGYTAWGVLQLQDEIRGGSWLVYKNVHISDVFLEIDNGNMLTSQSASNILGISAKV